MPDLHMGVLSDGELVEVIDQAIGSLHARLTDADELAESHPASEHDDIKREADALLKAWEPVAARFEP